MKTEVNPFLVHNNGFTSKLSGFEKRAQYYAAKAYFSQMKAGEEYNTLKEVIVSVTKFSLRDINILRDNIGGVLPK